jgi:hypothetical protein
MHGGRGVKPSLNRCYYNATVGHEAVLRLYAGGILEADRVLKRGGLIIVKSQDEIESGRQRLTHIELINLLEMLGFLIRDVFVLVQATIPVMREKSARKNHSFAIVAQLRR